MNKKINFSRYCMMAGQKGFTLIEMAIVVVIAGIIISIVATVLPSLIQSSKIRQGRAELEKFDYALQGYISANGRCPCPDTDNDGSENRDDGGTPDDATDDTCDAYVGDLPYISLGLSSADDTWHNPIRYGVYEDFIKTAESTFCDDLETFATATFDDTRLHTTDSGSNSTHQAYVMVSGGPEDKDGSSGYFDGLNGDADVEFEIADKIMDADYDDLVRVGSFYPLQGKLCTGGGESGDDDGGSENCSNGVDDDGDQAIDCEDPDCEDNEQCAESEKVTIVESTIPDTEIGATLSHTFQATGGESYPQYYWSLESVPAELSGKLSLGYESGTLTGTLDVCFSDSPFVITVRAEDRTPLAETAEEDTYDEKDFEITVVQGTMTIRSTPSELPDPDFTVDETSFSETFEIEGDYLGPFSSESAWSIQWGDGDAEDDPGGFQIDAVSDTEAEFQKSAGTTQGTYTFKLTAVDDGCPENSVTSDTYTVTITESGASAPYTADLEAEWHFNECSWSGAAGEVIDSGTAALDGTAQGGATTSGSGKNCRSGFFDGTDDYVTVESTDELKQTGEFTLALWVKVLAGASDWVRLAGKGDSTNRNYGLWLATNGTILFQIYSDGGNGNAQTSTTVNDGNWHHVVGVYDGAAMTVYIDGEEKKSISYSNDPRTSDDPFTMGYAGFHTYLNGLLDEVMLFHKALPADSTTETSVKDIYEITRSTCSGSCYTDPIAEYRMENFGWNGTAEEVLDSGTGGNHGTAALAGSGQLPAQTTPSNGKVCRSGEFVRVDANNGGYLDMGDPSDGDLDPDTDSWTISAWIKWDGASGESIIYNKESLYEARVSSGYVNYAWQPHWAWDGGSNFPVDADTWTYVTTVYNGVQQMLYKDGSLVYARSETGGMGGNSSKLLIGARGSGSPRNFFSGFMDEVKIYNRALAENEIAADMEESRDCTADTVVITSTALPDATVGESDYSSSPDPVADGGTPPYVWSLVDQDAGLNLTMPDISTGLLEGAIDTCSGVYTVTVSVTDQNSRMDEVSLPLTVANGTLSISDLPTTLDCDSTTCSWDFTVTGPILGDLENWDIAWQGGSSPGGFEVASTGANTATFRKSGTSAAADGYRFKLTAQDSACSDNQLETGYDYTLNVAAGAQGTPYYSGLQAEWRMDECTWNGTSGEVVDGSGNGLNGTAANGVQATGAGKLCQAGYFDGADDHILLGGILDDSGDAFADDSTAFTIALWVNPESLNSSATNHITENVIFSKADDTVNDNLEIGVNTDGTVHVYLDTESVDTYTDFGNAGDVKLYEWHFIAVSYEEGTVTVTINDSTYENTTTWSAATDIDDASGATVSIGSSQHSDIYFNGLIDEVMVWNRALSADDIDEVYDRTRDTCEHTCYNPVGEWHFDECDDWDGTADEIIDEQGGAHGFSSNMNDLANFNRQTGKVCRGGAFNLDDTTDQRVNLGYGSFQNLNDFSLCMWFRIEALSSSITPLFSGAVDGTNNNTMLIYFDATGSNIITWINQTQSGSFPLGGTDVQDGLWHHLVWTRDQSTGGEVVYLDGSEISDGDSDDPTDTLSFGVDGAIVGQEQDSLNGGFAANQIFQGWMDEVNLFDRILTHQEVEDIASVSRECSVDCYTSAIALYKLDQDWSDSSGNGYPDGSPSASGTDFPEGCDGWAAEFDKSQSGSAGFSGLTALSSAAGEKSTVTFWMKWNGADNEVPFFWEGQNCGLWIRNLGTGDIRFGINSGSGDIYGVVDDADPSAIAGQWIHVGVVYENNGVYSGDTTRSRALLYLNGTLQPSALVYGSAIADRSVGTAFRLSGITEADTTYKFDGMIDEVRIYDRGLSASEILADLYLSEPCLTVLQSQ